MDDFCLEKSFCFSIPLIKVAQSSGVQDPLNPNVHRPFFSIATATVDFNSPAYWTYPERDEYYVLAIGWHFLNDESYDYASNKSMVPYLHQCFELRRLYETDDTSLPSSPATLPQIMTHLLSSTSKTER